MYYIKDYIMYYTIPSIIFFFILSYYLNNIAISKPPRWSWKIL